MTHGFDDQGAKYDAEGKCTFIPGQSLIPPKARARVYPIVERHTLAWIWIGDADKAHPASIPDVHWLDEDDPYVNPMGSKGIGELGIVGTAAAIANAVHHATGIRVRDLPITLDKLL